MKRSSTTMTTGMATTTTTVPEQKYLQTAAFQLPGFNSALDDYHLILFLKCKKFHNNPALPQCDICHVRNFLFPPVTDIYAAEPWNLHPYPLTGGQEYALAFTVRKSTGRGMSAQRTAGNGKWKATSKPVDIMHEGKVVGVRRLLSYHYNKVVEVEKNVDVGGGGGETRKRKKKKVEEEKVVEEVKTAWNMDEFTLGDGDKGSLFQELVLCRIKFSSRPENDPRMEMLYATDPAARRPTPRQQEEALLHGGGGESCYQQCPIVL